VAGFRELRRRTTTNAARAGRVPASGIAAASEVRVPAGLRRCGVTSPGRSAGDFAAKLMVSSLQFIQSVLVLPS
jgi:hypothetical protein